MRKRFLWIDRTDYAGPLNEDDFECSWSYFEDVRAFFKKALEAGKAVIFTADQ